ncbi:hypothetical protein BGX29_003607 [Mortierella sp. GBA35]|nr:hypothetical protein BGX29_003607 [Mortierella sp. GBA35]
MRQAIVFLFAILALISVVISAPVDPAPGGPTVEPPVDPAPGGPDVDPGQVDPAPDDIDPGFNASAAPLLRNGNYLINRESYHNPIRYFSGNPQKIAWPITLEPKSTTGGVLQVWRLRNHSRGMVSLELVGNTGYYLGQGKRGPRPGAYVGTTVNQQKWKLSRDDDDHSRYKLTFPTKVNGQKLVLNQSPYYIDPPRLAFAYEDPDVDQSWRFARIWALGGSFQP